MSLHRQRWVHVLAALALGLQLLIASGLAMSGPSEHCGAMQTQTTNGDGCQGCGTHEHRAGAASNATCKVACAVASVAAPPPRGDIVMQAPRDVDPTSVVSLPDQSSRDDLLRPPARAAVRAA